MNRRNQIYYRFILLVFLGFFSLNMACKTVENPSDVEDITTSSEPLNNDSIEADSEVEQGLYESKRDSVMNILKTQLFNEYQTDANRLSSFYILAQQRFFGGEYEEALFLINQAERIKATPDVLALKGSIYLGLGSIDEFVSNWREALSQDANIPIPPSPAVVNELKKQGLLNDNLERNF